MLLFVFNLCVELELVVALLLKEGLVEGDFGFDRLVMFGVFKGYFRLLCA